MAETVSDLDSLKSWYNSRDNKTIHYCFKKQPKDCEHKFEDYAICSAIVWDGTVQIFTVIHKQTGTKFTMKAVRKLKKNMKYLINEIKVADKLKKLKWVCVLKHVFESNDYMFMMFENMDCSLADIKSECKIGADNIGHIFSNLIHAIYMVQNEDVIIVDLNEESIMFDKMGNLKLWGFGQAFYDKDDPILEKERMENIVYVAPEIKNNRVFDKVSDLYSLGKILCGFNLNLSSLEGKLMEEDYTKRIELLSLFEDETVLRWFRIHDKAKIVEFVENTMKDRLSNLLQDFYDEDFAINENALPSAANENLEKVIREWRDIPFELHLPKLFKESYSSKCKKPCCGCKEDLADYKLNHAIKTAKTYIVFEAEKGSQKFAVKAYLKTRENARKYVIETRIHQRAKHVNILEPLHSFETNNCLFVVSELCVATASQMRLGEKIDPLNVVLQREHLEWMAYGIVGVLRYLSENQVVHTNLTPRNVMFTKSGVLKLTGFGKSVDLTRDNLHIREKESTLYLAPELKEGYVTVKSPYWNLGRILNEISADIVLSPKTTGDKEYTEFVNGLKKRSTADRIGFYDPRLMPKFLETKREKLKGCQTLRDVELESFMLCY